MSSKRPEVVEIVARDTQADGFASGECDLRGKTVAVGVTNLMGLRCRVDLDEFVAGGEDGDPGPGEDFDLSSADGGERGDVRGGDAGARRDERIAAAGFAAGRDDVAAGAELAIGLETDFAVRDLNMLEHDHGVGAFRDGCAGHDFERGAGGQRRGRRRFASAKNAGYGKPLAATEGCGLDGIAVARGAMEGREIAIGADGNGEDAVEGIEEWEALGALRRRS